MRSCILVLLLCVSPCAGADAPGTHLPLKGTDDLPRSFYRGDRVVGTYYFYWYNDETREHFLNGDGTDALQDHPAEAKGYSYARPEWHRAQLLDMMEAGIDFFLPVYWGVPGRPDEWSVKGIRALAEALDGLAKEGKQPPRVGLFYDTTTLDKVDLTTEAGRTQLYETARDFYSLLPPRDWALWDGRPIVWLYSSGYPSRLNAAAFRHLRAALRRDFGGRDPFLVGDPGWEQRAKTPGLLDATYSWGAALDGPHVREEIVELGPGYNDHAVPGRKTPVRDREQGRFYERSWRAATGSDATVAMVETWNELHEATDVSATREHGRSYIDATRRLGDQFRRRAAALLPKGPFRGAKEITWAPGAEKGLSPVPWEDGLIDIDAERLVTRGNAVGPARYIYFRVEESFPTDEAEEFDLEVEVLDGSPMAIGAQFNGIEEDYEGVGAKKLKGSGAWVTLTFHLAAARFERRQNGMTDLRLSVSDADITLRRVRLLRK